MFERSGNLLFRNFRKYLIPATLSSMSMMLGVIINGIIVGQFIGADAMAAVNVAEPLILFFQAIFFLLGMGGATLVAISKGERNEKKANTVYVMSCLTLLVLAMIIMVSGLFFLDPLVRLICNEPSLYNLTREFVQVLLIGTPFMLFVPGMVFFIRVDGQPMLSANILLVANGVNLVANLIFINVFHLGIGAAALATVTGYMVGFVLVLRYWLSKKRTLRFVKPCAGDVRLLGQIAGYGIAGSVNTMLLTVKTLCINLIVMSVGGADGMAVFAVCNFSISFVSMFIVGASDAMVPLLGLLFGEKDWKGISFVLKRTMTVVIACCAASILLLQLFPVQVLSLFNVVSELQVAMGVPALRIFAFSLLGVGISYTYMYYLQTTKHRYLSVTISVLRGFVLIIPLAFLLSFFWGMGGIWWAYVAAEALTLIITLLLCKFTALRSAGRYSGVFLAQTPPQGEALYDVTVSGEAEGAVAVSQGLIEFGRLHGLAEAQAKLVGLAAEEAVISIMEYNRADTRIAPLKVDLLCRIRSDDIILNLRDDGKPFDALYAIPDVSGALKEPAVSEKSSMSGEPVAKQQVLPLQELDGAAKSVPSEKTAFWLEEHEPGLDCIAVIKHIAQSVEYTHALGLNNTVIVLKKA